ncbi:MAG: DUF1223 domain-containing protein [Bacteroidota bacterium]
MTRIKELAFTLLTIVIVSFALLSFDWRESKNTNSIELPTAVEADKFVIIELFTSQGCSSCPAADRLLSQIIDEAQKNDLPIYGLSFHVNYWNYLGWKDPYSSENFTNRQREYASQFRLSSIYTPQMVVNGSSEFVGSNQSAASGQIKNAISQQAKATISLSHLNVKDGVVDFKYDFKGDSENIILNLALVERNLEDDVTRGENRGRKLRHDNVVRELKTIKPSTNGTEQLSIPKGAKLDDLTVIAYAQQKSDLAIIGATGHPIN